MNFGTLSRRLTLFGILPFCLAQGVASPAQAQSGYWKRSGSPQVVDRWVSPAERGYEYAISASGPDFVTFNYVDGGRRTVTTFKWSLPETIAPGEIAAVSIDYETSGARMGDCSVALKNPDSNSTVAGFVTVQLGPNSPPSGHVANTTVKAPSGAGDAYMSVHGSLTGGLSYGVKVVYTWMKGAREVPPASPGGTGVTPPVANPPQPPVPPPPTAPPGSSTLPPHVVGRGDRVEPAPGYDWDTDAAGDFRVHWSPGLEHPSAPHVVAGPREGEWVPAPGYEWVPGAAGDLRVRPRNTGKAFPGSQSVTPGGGASATCAEEIVIFSNNNSGAVSNTPTRTSSFMLIGQTRVTNVVTYHWNDGLGWTPGTIGLRYQDGTQYGPWQAVGEPGSGGAANIYWVVRPGVLLKPGTYTILDSHDRTWSQNARSNGEGIAIVKGCAVR